MTITIDSRAAAAQAGALTTFHGDARQQEFRSEIRASRSVQGDKEFLVLDGYASTVEQGYTMYDIFGPYTEVIDRGAFDLTLASNPDVNFLVNHTGMSMARTLAGTLELSADDHGLRSIASLNPQRNDVHDLELALRDGAFDQMSFAFRIEAGDWSPDFMTFRIRQVNLDRGDVSAVNYGANPNTSISARAKQALDAIDHLEGEPLRIAAARATARLADQERSVEPVVNLDPLSVGDRTTVEVAHKGPNIRTLRSLLALDER
ncbi:HK97 family phage prohead protease [Leifsonia sp. NPDC056824]|uniref:HK97 family phage prohead protease n=1 Tax=Leifsonia sp. NPDC056824 TaxID=3345953 RepID=UPI0036B9C93C